MNSCGVYPLRDQPVGGPLGLDGLQDHLSAQAVRALCALTIVLLSHLLESLVSQLARFIRPALRALPEPQR